ncbi:DUF2179 domain-containing protein, partial [bacterium]
MYSLARCVRDRPFARIDFARTGRPTMTIFLAALTIFLLRIGDVTMGTLRVIFLVGGRRAPAMALAFCESAIWIVAIRQVFKDPTPAQMFGYACGYACGTLVGISVDQFIGIGKSVVRVITREPGPHLRDRLAAEGFGLTTFEGMGVNGPVQELILVIPRRRRKQLIAHVHEIDPNAFITVEAAADGHGGGYHERPVRDHNK